MQFRAVLSADGEDEACAAEQGEGEVAADRDVSSSAIDEEGEDDALMRMVAAQQDGGRGSTVSQEREGSAPTGRNPRRDAGSSSSGAAASPSTGSRRNRGEGGGREGGGGGEGGGSTKVGGAAAGGGGGGRRGGGKKPPRSPSKAEAIRPSHDPHSVREEVALLLSLAGEDLTATPLSVWREATQMYHKRGVRSAEWAAVLKTFVTQVWPRRTRRCSTT